MVERRIKKLGQLNCDIKLGAVKKIPHADCLLRTNAEDDEQTAFFNAIAMNEAQDHIDYGNRGWQLDKLQRVKLQGSQQVDKLLKEVYCWVLNKKSPEPRQVKNGTSKELWSQYINFCLIEGILYRKHQHNPILRLFTECLYHGRDFPTCLSCCKTLLAQVTFGLKEHNKGPVKAFIGRA